MEAWPVDHPRYTPTFEEQIQRLEAATVGEAQSFWAMFAGAQGGTMSVVGDFDPAEIRPIVEEIFGDWTSQEPYSRVDDPYHAVETVSAHGVVDGRRCSSR